MGYYENVKEKLEKLKDKKDIIILAIESSCDETSIAIVKNGREVLSNVISSQIDIHTKFGGVVPEIASRNHNMAIVGVYNEALRQANMTITDIDAIAVTYGAGLIGALMVGVSFAKGLAYSNNLPLIKVNHIFGHISANYIETKDLVPPFVCLVVSGGHTAILKVEDFNKHKYIGGTLDDAIGEAYDKVARVVGLGYPGGPKVDKASKQGVADHVFVKHNTLKNTFDFSYSGLKTACINYIHTKEQKGEEINVPNLCASFQAEAVSELVEKTIRAAKKEKMNLIALAGGVSANSYLREKMKTEAEKSGINVVYPSLKLCTDNAAMIGSSAYFSLLKGEDISDLQLTPKASLRFYQD